MSDLFYGVKIMQFTEWKVISFIMLNFGMFYLLVAIFDFYVLIVECLKNLGFKD